MNPFDSVEDKDDKLQICVTMMDRNIIKGNPHESIRLGERYIRGLGVENRGNGYAT
jgi:hypothetical protein